MNGAESSEVRAMIREEIGRLWKKVDTLEEKLNRLTVRLAQVAVVTGGIVTVGNMVAAILLHRWFGFFGGMGP